jgi:ubiquinone/menaquinone biosynthesis C-methylase UbiE
MTHAHGTNYSKYRRLYNWMARIYAPLVRLFPMWRRYIEAVLPWLLEGGAVLEIGPGPGILLQQIADRQPFAVGLDLSRGMLNRAQRRVASLDSAQLVQGNAVRLPFAEGAFDGVVLTFTFSAIPDGQPAMDGIARVLRPGGVVALVDATQDGGRIAYLLGQAWKLFGDIMRDEAALMRAAGLDVVEQRMFGAFDSIRITVGRKPAAPPDA